MSSSPPATRVDWRLALLIFAAVFVLAAPQAALLPLLDRDEPRFAEAAREMRQSGDFVVPTFNGAPRYAKPPLIYWTQVAAYEIFGENAFAARLPSLLATAATACLLSTWGARLGGAQVGLGAALSYAFCFQAMLQGRVATADALLIFFMTLTAFAGWQIIRPRASGPCSPLCHGALALGIAGGFLAKGPEALLPLLPLVWCLRRAGHPSIMRIVAALVASLSLVWMWAMPALVESHGDYLRVGLSEGVGQRMVTGLQGHGAASLGAYLITLPLYFVLFWASALPWSPLLVMHRRKLFTGWRPDLADTYLLLNAALIFLVFTLMVTKLPHYTLPAFPFLALLVAKRWCEVGHSPGLLVRLALISGLVFALLAAIGIPVALIEHATPSPVGELVHAAGADLKPDTQFALVDFAEPNAIWEMRRVTHTCAKIMSEAKMREFLDEPGPRALILPTQIFTREGSAFHGSTPWHICQARGFNAAKGRLIDLTLVVKP